jgi:prolyl-tRNA editing enzyme YbaK/EbsC (Cys-tRNA(Pro) deacylase)
LTKGIERVREFFASKGLSVRVVELEESTKSSQLAAEALGCSVPEIAKSVVFTGPVTAVVVTSGDRRVDVEKLSCVVGEGMRIASAREVRDLTGYVAGGVPPFPHHPGILVFPDLSLRRFERVWAAAGEQNAVLQISVEDLVRTLGAPEMDLSK